MNKQSKTVEELRNGWYRYFLVSEYDDSEHLIDRRKIYYLTKTVTVNNRTYYLLFDQTGHLLEKVYDFVNKYRNDLY